MAIMRLVLVLVILDKCLAKPPNIIFILSDDLGYGDVSISPGVNRTHSIPTPNVQRLADNGLRLLRAYSGPVCAPSRCVLMTGLHQGHCTVRGNGGSYTPLLPHDVTVAEVLKKAGYYTAVVGKWGLGDFNTTGYPLNQGFDTFVGQDSQMSCHNWYPAIIQNDTNGQQEVPANINASKKTCGEHRSKCKWSNDLFNEQAIRIIRQQAHADQPFFLYFATTTPHTGFLKGDSVEYAVPAPYDTRFPQYTPQMQSLFAAATSAQDDFVGAVLDELQKQNIEENTVVFFSGDNGPDSHPFGLFDDPGPFRGKKRSLHEGGMRQTIAVRWKGHVSPNTTSNHLFAFWDLLPTAAELAGVPTSQWPATDGVSIAPLLLGQSNDQKEHEYLYWEFCYYGNAGGLLPQQYDKGWGQAIRMDESGTEWKAIRANRGTVLLYNLTNDISESMDVSKKFPKVVSRVVSLMEQSHVEDPFWKSSNNQSDKCCSSCSHERGCPAPCVMMNSTGNVPSAAPYVPAQSMMGWWNIERSDSTFLAAKEGEEPWQWSVHSSKENCWSGGVLSVDESLSDDLEVWLLSNRCEQDEVLGHVTMDGSSLWIKWNEKDWPDWEKPFDYD